MVSGLNSDVRHEGVVYHVQTEDRRASGGEIVSLVYHRGRILQSVRQSPPSADDADGDAAARRQQVTLQHRLVIRSILHGRIGDPDQPSPPALTIEPTLIVSPLQDLRANARASLLVLLRDGRSFRPIPAARLAFWFNGGQGDPLAVHEAATDPKGFHLAEFDLPDFTGEDLSLHLEARFPDGRTEAHLQVLPSRPLNGRASPVVDPLEMIVSDLDAPRMGARSSLLLLVRRRASCRPVDGAAIRIDLALDDASPRPILEAQTDGRGFLLGEFDLPDERPREASLIVRAEAGGERCEWVLPVLVDGGNR